MKILHTSDWHLGKYLNTYSRYAEQQEVLEEICEIADREKVDVVLVAGDLFDTYNPPAESAELLYKTLKRLAKDGERAVIAIAGNHDSPERIEAPDPLARACGILFAGYPHSVIPLFGLDSGLKGVVSEEGIIVLELPGSGERLRLLYTPYANEFRLKTYLGSKNPEDALRLVLQERWKHLADAYCDDQGVNVLVAHLLFMNEGDDLPDEPEDEKPILQVGGAQAVYTANIPRQIQYTALGHLHRKQRVDSGTWPVMYAGSPLSYSFSEAGQQKYVVVAELQAGKTPVIKSVELTRGKQLQRKRFENADEAVTWLEQNPDCLVELTMATKTFLTVQERRQIFSAHQGIVSLIPEVEYADDPGAGSARSIDPNKNITELFSDYFKNARGQEPNGVIMNIFNEVLSEEVTP